MASYGTWALAGVDGRPKPLLAGFDLVNQHLGLSRDGLLGRVLVRTQAQKRQSRREGGGPHDLKKRAPGLADVFAPGPRWVRGVGDFLRNLNIYVRFLESARALCSAGA
jgi:hypothetical protein